MDFKILGSLSGLMTGSVPGNVGSAPANTQAPDFQKMLQGAVQGVMNDQKEAATLTAAVANGDPVPMQEVIRAVGKAEMTLQTMITVRDRAVEAYQQIQQMPI